MCSSMGYNITHFFLCLEELEPLRYPNEVFYIRVKKKTAEIQELLGIDERRMQRFIDTYEKL